MNEERVEDSLAGRGVGRKKYRCFSHLFLAKRCARHPNPHYDEESLTARPASRFRFLLPFYQPAKANETSV